LADSGSLDTQRWVCWGMLILPSRSPPFRRDVRTGWPGKEGRGIKFPEFAEYSDISPYMIAAIDPERERYAAKLRSTRPQCGFDDCCGCSISNAETGRSASGSELSSEYIGFVQLERTGT